MQKGRPPVFLQKISDVEIVAAKQSAEFTCKVTGVPKPEVTWLIEGKSLLEGPRHRFDQKGDGRCALIITDVTSEDDAIYTCLAKNDQGQACCSAELVFGKLSNFDLIQLPLSPPQTLCCFLCFLLPVPNSNP